MGEIAEQVVNGLLCQKCITYMEDFEEPGHARTCKDCLKENEIEDRKNS